MKRAIFLIAALLLVAAAIPQAHAAIRVQGFGSTPFSFDGPTSVAYTANGASGYYYSNMNNRYVGATVNDRSAAFQLQRPSTTTYHRYDDQNQNYRSIDYGSWQLQRAAYRGQNSQFTASNNYGHWSLRGQAGSGYQGNTWYGRGYNGFANSYNMNSYSYPSPTGSYGWSRTQSAYIRTGIVHN